MSDVTSIGRFYICQYFYEVVQGQELHTAWRFVNHRTPGLQGKPRLLLADFPKQARTLKRGQRTTVAVSADTLKRADRIQQHLVGPCSLAHSPVSYSSAAVPSRGSGK